MDYQGFAAILNYHLLSSERHKMLDVLTRHPERFVGAFRPHKPESKLVQYLLSSRGIKFGDAIEEALQEMLADQGYQLQDPHIAAGLECDQYFLSPDGERAFLIEQKMRDDHNSTKRVGQWENFREKVEVLFQRHGRKLVAAMYFVDPEMSKNKPYYERELDALRSDLGLPSIHLWYGGDLFERLGLGEDWDRLKRWLKQWRADLPVFPELNCETEDALDEIRKLAREDPQLWDRFARCRELWEESIVRKLFPTGKGLLVVVAELGKINADETAAALMRQLEKFYEIDFDKLRSEAEAQKGQE